MKTGADLALIAVGAILAFAVNATPSWLNLHTVGWVLILVGLVGLVLPRRTYGWLGRRIQTGRTYPATRVTPAQYTTRPAGASITIRWLRNSRPFNPARCCSSCVSAPLSSRRISRMSITGFPSSLRDQFAMISSVAARVLSIRASSVGSGVGTAMLRCVPQRLTFAGT